MPLKIVMGLGNPGKKYFKTRHNLGFWAVDLLSERLETKWRDSRLKSAIASAEYEGWNLILAEPTTFMNLSGEAARLILAHYQASPQDLLVICDDINLPVGKIRIRKQGGTGGHHGLGSLILCLGSQEFPRIRIGIRPLDSEVLPNLEDFVLSPFPKGEEAIVSESVKKAGDAVLCLLEEGIEAAMNLYNNQ
jgi:PTH1 family peptidyl-tRNA hydrolase